MNDVAVARIRITRPFPWDTLLGYLHPRIIPGAESVDLKAGAYHRTGICTVSMQADALQVTAAAPELLDLAVARVRALLRPGLETEAIDRQLATDPRLRTSVDRVPGLRLPGTWSAFELACRVVIGQQVTVAAARTLLARVVDRCGGSLTPNALATANSAALGMPQARVDTLLRLADLAEQTGLEQRPWSELRPRLAALKGIGPWTLGYLDMRLGLLPDIFPAADVGLQIACDQRDARKLAASAARWAPYRSFAAVRLWHGLAQNGAERR